MLGAFPPIQSDGMAALAAAAFPMDPVDIVRTTYFVFSSHMVGYSHLVDHSGELLWRPRPPALQQLLTFLPLPLTRSNILLVHFTVFTPLRSPAFPRTHPLSGNSRRRLRCRLTALNSGRFRHSGPLNQPLFRKSILTTLSFLTPSNFGPPFALAEEDLQPRLSKG